MNRFNNTKYNMYEGLYVKILEIEHNLIMYTDYKALDYVKRYLYMSEKIMYTVFGAKKGRKV